MKGLLRRVTIIWICSLLRVHAHDVSTISALNPTRQYGSVKSLKKSIGYPKILNIGTPANVVQNEHLFNNHYIYCDNLGQYTSGKIKSCPFSSEQIQQIGVQNDKIFDFSGMAPPLDSFVSDSHKAESYIGDKEIHILHLPKGEPQDFDDIKLHLSLLNAHSTPYAPEIDLELNKNFGNFEVNLASIKPPKLDSSFMPTPTTWTVNKIVKPLIQEHIPAQFSSKVNLHDQYGSEDYLEIPHIEKHPLEHDLTKSSYNTPGAVNSYGEPIWPSTHNSQNSYSSVNSEKSDQLNLAHFISDYTQGINPSYNSPDAVDSYGNMINNQRPLSFNKDVFFKPKDYFSQLNEINDALRARRQEINTFSGASKKDLIGYDKTEQETRHRNHRYN